MAMITRKMSVSEWIKVPDNPRQRDTVAHAKKAIRSHLAEASPTHSVVFAAMIEGQVVCKLDGHTRAFLWETGELEMPRHSLTVHCFECKSMADACALYTHFDNQSAVEAARDRLTGACRESGLVLQSSCLRKMSFVVALQCASGGSTARRQSEYELVELWRDELQELDSWDLGYMHTSLIALALVLIANNETTAKQFFQAFDKDLGQKTEAGQDGVHALTRHIDNRRGQKTMAGWENINDLFERAYGCFAAYRDGRVVKNVSRVSRKTFEKVAKRLSPIKKESVK